MPSSTYPATHRSGSNSLSGGFSAVCPLVNWIKVVVLIMKRSSSENRNAHRKQTAEGFRRKPQNCNNILWLPRERVWARRWLAEWRLKELVDSWLNVYNQITRYAGFLVVSEGTTCTACTAGSVCSFSGIRRKLFRGGGEGVQIPKANIFEVYLKQKFALCCAASSREVPLLCISLAGRVHAPFSIWRVSNCANM